MFRRCSRKSNLPSRQTPECFWNCICFRELLLKFSGGCDVFILRVFCWDYDNGDIDDCNDDNDDDQTMNAHIIQCIYMKRFKTKWSKFFKGCLPQILLGPFLNTLFHFIPYFQIVNWSHMFLRCLHHLAIILRDF